VKGSTTAATVAATPEGREALIIEGRLRGMSRPGSRQGGGGL
jgi:hypothetical protein